MRATVIIATRNRKDDLLKAVASALGQTASPEVLVLDDGSTDGTVEVVERVHPGVRCLRTTQSRGYIAQRNRGARLASGEIIFSLDDDAVFNSPTIIETTLQEFDDPRVGAVAIPFTDVNRSTRVNQRAPGPDCIYACYDFIGTAHGLRRDLFLALGGYREILFHQSEEEDYCIRMLNCGYIARLGNSDPIHHFESPRRSWTRMDYFGARNKVLYAWHNVPFPYFGGHIATTTVKTLLHTLSPARFWTRLKGVANAYRKILSGGAVRQAVTPAAYKLSRKLKKRGGIPIEEIESELSGLNSDRKANLSASVIAQPTFTARQRSFSPSRSK